MTELKTVMTRTYQDRDVRNVGYVRDCELNILENILMLFVNSHVFLLCSNV